MYKALLGAAFCALMTLAATSVQAGDRTYVSRTGSDSNSCLTPALACAGFQRAINQANLNSPKGEVYCLDSGFFGSVDITSAISIFCENHHGQLGVNVITINVGANDVVVINGIDLDQRNVPNLAGIYFSGGGTLRLYNSSIRGAISGVLFIPNANARLVIVNTTLEGNTGAGLAIQPTAAAVVKASIDGLRSVGNVGGVLTNAGPGISIELDIRNSLLAQNSNYGLASLGSGGVSAAFIDQSSISSNFSIGLYSQGANSFLLVSQSTIARNNIGWAFASGGTLASYGNNVVNSISATGGPSATIALQ